MAGLSTAASPFVVNNVQPAIASLMPNTSEAGGPGEVLTINGAGFVDGATVVWAGEPRTATFVSPRQLRVDIRADELTDAHKHHVRAVSPMWQVRR